MLLVNFVMLFQCETHLRSTNIFFFHYFLFLRTWRASASAPVFKFVGKTAHSKFCIPTWTAFRLILSDTPADSPSPLEACLRFYQTRLTPVGRRVGVQTRLIWPVRRVTSCWQAKACGVACLVGPQPASASAGWHASGMWQRHWITSEKHRTGWRNFQNSKNIHLAEAVLVKLKARLRLTPLQAEAEACDW